MKGGQLDAVGIVVIGRNEGERLECCLRAATAPGLPIVYVDSGSTDGSVEVAAALGVDVLELDASKPFTAARARNAGFEHLLERWPALRFVQFVDGDCELCDGWLERGACALRHLDEIAAVCGRVRERAPEASVYNRICELEWRQPIGLIDGCGGNVMLRVRVLREIGGFDADIIAAEDTELYARLRLAGWGILSIDADMVRHDAAMLTWRQWFRRAVRAGHAMTQGAVMHGRSPTRLFVRASRRISVYGLLVPLSAVILAAPTSGWSLLMLGVYPVMWGKTYAAMRREDRLRSEAALYASHCVVAKWPQGLGQAIYYWNRARGHRTRLIEHKHPAADGRAVPTRDAVAGQVTSGT